MLAIIKGLPDSGKTGLFAGLNEQEVKTRVYVDFETKKVPRYIKKKFIVVRYKTMGGLLNLIDKVNPENMDKVWKEKAPKGIDMIVVDPLAGLVEMLMQELTGSDGKVPFGSADRELAKIVEKLNKSNVLIFGINHLVPQKEGSDPESVSGG